MVVKREKAEDLFSNLSSALEYKTLDDGSRHLKSLSSRGVSIVL